MRALRKDRVGLERSLTTPQQTRAMVPAPGLEPGRPEGKGILRPLCDVITD